jgi:cobalt-zinc-cadmium efflux system outer membrane protein
MSSPTIHSASRAAIALAMLGLCVLSAPAGATDSQPTLPEAVRHAVDAAPRLQARRAQVEAATQEAKREGALPDPMLMVGIDNLPVTGADAFDTGADDMTMKKIGVRQEIPARAKREAQRTLATRRTDEAVALEQAERLDVAQATADAWIELWAADREQASLGALREQAELAARLAKARVSGGTGSAADALAARAAVVDLENEIEGAHARAQAARAELARWLGTDVEHVADTTPDFGSLPVSEAELLAGVDRSNRLLPAMAQVETASAQIDAARAERKSDWSVEASYGLRDRDRSDMFMIEVGIGLPAFRRSSTNGGVAAREAEYQAALATREDLRREQTARIRAGIARWQGLKRQVALHEESLLPLARDRSAVALAAYRAGGALQPWLEARRAELDVHRAHAEHKANLGRAWVALVYLIPAQEPQP